MLRHQTFKDYDEYVRKQGGKATRLKADLIRLLPRHTEGFRVLFAKAAPELLAGPVLCLGARSGAEVAGAAKAGFKGSQGLDLFPVGKHVVQGDWHNIPFPDASFPNVFSNSFDHCLDLDKMTNEIKRVLVPGGRLFFEATEREGFADLENRMSHGGNEALYWQKSDDLRDAFVARGFTLIKGWVHASSHQYVLKKD